MLFKLLDWSNLVLHLACWCNVCLTETHCLSSSSSLLYFLSVSCSFSSYCLLLGSLRIEKVKNNCIIYIGHVVIFHFSAVTTNFTCIFHSIQQTSPECIHFINLTLSNHVYPISNICKIRPFLTTYATQLIVQVLVLFRLVCCNSLLACAVRPLQHIQNAAARLVLNQPKYWHVKASPGLPSLITSFGQDKIQSSLHLPLWKTNQSEPRLMSLYGNWVFRPTPFNWPTD